MSSEDVLQRFDAMVSQGKIQTRVWVPSQYLRVWELFETFPCICLYDLLQAFPHRPGPPIPVRDVVEDLVGFLPVIGLILGRLDGPLGAKNVHILVVEDLGYAGAPYFWNMLNMGHTECLAAAGLDVDFHYLEPDEAMCLALLVVVGTCHEYICRRSS